MASLTGGNVNGRLCAVRSSPLTLLTVAMRFMLYLVWYKRVPAAMRSCSASMAPHLHLITQPICIWLCI